MKSSANATVRFAVEDAVNPCLRISCYVVVVISVFQLCCDLRKDSTLPRNRESWVFRENCCADDLSLQSMASNALQRVFTNSGAQRQRVCDGSALGAVDAVTAISSSSLRTAQRLILHFVVLCSRATPARRILLSEQAKVKFTYMVKM